MKNERLLAWLSPAVASLALLSPPPLQAADFDLLPKAFKANPLLDMTVITEMTDAGRQRPIPSREHPVYFASITRAMQETGRSDAGVQAPSVNRIDEVMQAALAKAGFLPAGTNQPPTVLVIVDWGVYNLPADHSGDGLGDPDPGKKMMTDRAALIGGVEFARKFQIANTEETMAKLSGATEQLHPMTSPLQDFRRKHFQLFDRLGSELYFVVATAFDYDSVTLGKKPVRLWRTKLTVDAASVNLTDTLPALIATGAPYFGREMPGTVQLRERALKGRTKLGPLEVMENDVKISPPPASGK